MRSLRDLARRSPDAASGDTSDAALARVQQAVDAVTEAGRYVTRLDTSATTVTIVGDTVRVHPRFAANAPADLLDGAITHALRNVAMSSHVREVSAS